MGVIGEVLGQHDRLAGATLTAKISRHDLPLIVCRVKNDVVAQ
jgi:hypothetical protein